MFSFFFFPLSLYSLLCNFFFCWMGDALACLILTMHDHTKLTHPAWEKKRRPLFDQDETSIGVSVGTVLPAIAH